ncbi:glycoside hydrolase family 88 protein [Sphingobacterium sp.]|uniref:glycoside hydrolase family 88/105 protein n=1 Tax=Sphingobacterium sp. TaxID=341027 RepID=UPI00289BDA96|nr:glycoside hydrolase family 88 protein [Sphingobacterium sp.]
MIKKIFLFLLFLPVQFLTAQTDLANFPTGADPKEVGHRIAHRFIAGKHMLHAGKWISYPETFYWTGAINYAHLMGDQELMQAMKARFSKLTASEPQLLPIKNHVDLNMFGSLPLRLYQLTKEKSYLDLGLPYADTQWELPQNASQEAKDWAQKGYSWQTRLWIDDMYMITIVQAAAFKATGKAEYLDRAAREMVLYLDELQRPNGLFFHAPDVPYYWGRGNGWMAAGMTELLRMLPQDHPNRPRILKGYLTMMKSLKKQQRKSGMWNQLIDQADCWAETSGSAMFAYAIISGVKQGWLGEKQYGPVARKAWLALAKYVDDQGAVSEICVGTNKKNDKQYYYDRPRHTGDYHGQAAYMWCVNALLEGSTK